MKYLIHTALITAKVNENIKKSFVDLKDTIYMKNKKKHLNERYRNKGIVFIGYYIIKPGYIAFYIEIKINFKKLIDENYDKKSLLVQADSDKIEVAFNEVIKELDIGLPLFEKWKVNRIDYCVNIKTPYVKEYINILNKSDMPYNLTYGSGSSRNYSKADDSFYLVKKKNGKRKYTENARINFYNKQEQLKNLKEQGKEITDEQIAAAKDILRLEVQCFKPKTEYLKLKYSMTTKNIYHFLNAEISYDVIYRALSQIARVGDYKRKSKALKLIDARRGSVKVNNMLKQIIKDVAVQHNAVYKVREKYIEQEISKDTFNRWLRELDKLNVNPVTISDTKQLERKRYDDGLKNLFDLFKEAFNESYYDKEVEVDIEEDLFK